MNEGREVRGGVGEDPVLFMCLSPSEEELPRWGGRMSGGYMCMLIGLGEGWKEVRYLEDQVRRSGAIARDLGSTAKLPTSILEMLDES